MRGKFGRNTWKVVLGGILLRILVVFCIAAIGFAVFLQIKKVRNKENEETVEENTVDENVAEENTAEEKTAEETAKKKGSEKIVTEMGSWQEAYAETLRQYIEQTPGITPQFSLECIDGDDIPEMIIVDGGAHVCGCAIYTFYQESVVNLGEFGDYGTVSYVPSEGLICSDHVINGGYYIRRFFTIENGQADMAVTFYEDYNTPAYQVNDEDVSEEEYNSRWNEWSEADEKRVTRGYGNGCVEINDANIEVLLSSDFTSLFGCMQGGE